MTIAVDKEDFEQIVSFIKKANNFHKSIPDQDGGEVYLVMRDSGAITAAEMYIDDENNVQYHVRDGVFHAWKTMCGYSL